MSPKRLDARDPGTAAAIHRVWKAAYRVEADLLGVAEQDFPPLRRTAEEIQAASCQFFGISVEGTLAAVAEVEDSAEAVNLSALVVHPDFFRRGLAKRLVRHLLDEAFPTRAFTVSTGAANQPALRLYQKLGFHIVEYQQGRGGIDLVRLENRVRR